MAKPCITDPVQLSIDIDAYFQHCEESKKEYDLKSGGIKVRQEFPSVAGLCVWLGISRDSFYKYIEESQSAERPTQTTTNTAATTTYLNKTFYDRKMLVNAKARLVYQQFGQKRPIPRNSGKTVEFRKWTLFAASSTTQSLTEGVTPSSQSLGQTKVEATVAQYGAFVEISDLLEMTAYDPVIGDSAELLGEQLGTVADNVTRDAMISDASDQFAGAAANANGVTATSYLTVEEIRKAVRTLKKNKARMFTGGKKPHFVCIVDADATYDLQSDALWQDVSKYSNAEQIYDGELGRLFGVVFVETSEGYSAANTAATPVTLHHSLIFGSDAYGVIHIQTRR